MTFSFQEVLTQGHRASKFCNQDLNLGSLAPEKRWVRGLAIFLETVTQCACESSDILNQSLSEQVVRRCPLFSLEDLRHPLVLSKLQKWGTVQKEKPGTLTPYS